MCTGWFECTNPSTLCDSLWSPPLNLLPAATSMTPVARLKKTISKVPQHKLHEAEVCHGVGVSAVLFVDFCVDGHVLVLMK